MDGYISFFHNPFWSAVKEKFDSGAETGQVSDVTDFDWEVVCILAPYSIVQGDRSEITKAIPYDLGAFHNRIPNVGDDGIWAFVFINSGKVVNIQKKGFGYYLEASYKKNCIPREKAKFVTGKDRLDSSYIIITDI